MNAGPTSERVYLALKALILERGVRPGERLDPARLGDRLASSVTPVRDALYRLTGEGLVETRISDGFSVPMLDEPSLVDRYRWNNAILQAILRAGPPVPQLFAVDDSLSLAERTVALFAAFAASTDNPEAVRAIDDLNARLHAARTVEPSVLSTARDHFSVLADYFRSGERRQLSLALNRYHRQRERAAAAILRALYRDG